MTSPDKFPPPDTDKAEASSWQGWQPDWTAPTPHSLQEPKAATIQDNTVSARRRIVDARLWNAMSPLQRQAALQVTLAFEVMGKGLGYKISSWESTSGGGHDSAIDAHARLIGHYIDWTKRCFKNKISHSMIIDVLVFGSSLGQSDRDRRLRKGSARRNLLNGLSLYAAMRGWQA
jgi:hypothetical protein